MSSTVEIIADSIAPSRVRLTTMLMTYPARIHWDVLMHRMLSRSVSSTRAIPYTRPPVEGKKVRPGMREWVAGDPYIPLHWGAEKPGQQSGGLLSPEDQDRATQVWRGALGDMIARADELHRIGVHKSDINALLIPFMHMNVVITACEDGWANFFNLRAHPDAKAEFQQVAVKAMKLYREHRPRYLESGEWHLPFITESDWRESGYNAGYRADRIHGSIQLAKVSSARCARTSHLTTEGLTPTIAEDLKLYKRLVGSDPKHANPVEHQAKAEIDPDIRSGNFRGWVQHRQTIAGESATAATFDIDLRLAMYGDRDYIIKD